MTHIDDSFASPLASRTPVRTGPGQGDLSDAPLKGEVCTQFIRCNKSGCRCQTGAPHGPYYYRVWRDGGRVHKVYVKSADVASVRAACDSYKSLSLQLRALRSQREQLSRQLHGEWRKMQRLIRSSDRSKPGA